MGIVIYHSGRRQNLSPCSIWRHPNELPLRGRRAVQYDVVLGQRSCSWRQTERHSHSPESASFTLFVIYFRYAIHKSVFVVVFKYHFQLINCQRHIADSLFIE